MIDVGNAVKKVMSSSYRTSIIVIDIFGIDIVCISIFIVVICI